MKLVIVFALALSVAVVNANSTGGSEKCCVDMIPLHGAPPQTTFAASHYRVAVSKNTISDNEHVDITISGKDPFKGYLIQVRDADGTAVGSFNIPANDAHSKTINCFTKKENMATHNNASDKKSLKVSWKPPKGIKKTYTVYVTVAQSGTVYWVREPTEKITVQ